MVLRLEVRFQLSEAEPWQFIVEDDVFDVLSKQVGDGDD
jgi:hypothetical protein